jgi:membrane-associated phospholipid phosphatase
MTLFGRHGFSLLFPALVSSALVARPARAESTLVVARPLEIGLTLGGLALVGVAELEKNALTPRHCGWCDPPGFDASLQRSLRWSSTHDAGLLSNITVAVTPVAMVGGLWLANLHGPLDEHVDDTLLVAESVTVTLVLTDIAKLSVARERPRVHVLSPAERAARPYDRQDNLSFFSSHTSFAFALACSAGTVASLRGYAGAPYIWAGGLGLASAVGYLRIAADAHYTSDVVIGALVGSAVGISIPLLHRRTAAPRVALEPFTLRSARGLSLSGSF